MSDVYRLIESLNINNKYVVAAISGGPDSMFLLEVLLNLRGKLNLNIVVAHIHHNLRKESDEEAINLKKYCEDNNLIFEFKKIESYPNNKFSEESARNFRYNFFDELMKKYNADTLFTAHHGDDQIETILMRISRGSSLKGYAGIAYLTKERGYKIARPLLYITKENIISYLDKNNIWYAVDKSNIDLKYTRNRYRMNILPELKKENKNIHMKYNDFSNKLLLADKYIKNEALSKYEGLVCKNEINIDEFNKLDKILKIYILEEYLKNIYLDNISLINSKHIDIILNKITNNKNMSFDLPGDYIAVIEYGMFKIINNLKDCSYKYEFTDDIKLRNGKRIYVDNSTTLTSNFVIHLNSSEIKLPFIVRTREEGDFIYVKNLGGKKKVSDIFTDAKINKELRDSYPIVTDSTGEIIWIPGIKKSHLDRKKEGIYDIILKYD